MQQTTQFFITKATSSKYRKRTEEKKDSFPQCVDLNTCMINKNWKIISKEMESLEQLRLSKKLNDQLIDLRSKNIKSISINSTKELILVHNIIVNDITSFKSTYENIREVNKKNESHEENENNDTITLKHSTYLVVVDSNTYFKQKARLFCIERCCQWCCWQWGNCRYIDDMYHYLIPILNKKPDYIVLRTGENDAVGTEATVIVNKLLQLKCFVK